MPDTTLTAFAVTCALAVAAAVRVWYVCYVERDPVADWRRHKAKQMRKQGVR